MAVSPVRVCSAEEALVAEAALALLREVQQAATAAPDGQVLAVAETVALEGGRELTRRVLETALNAQAQEVEKKGRRAGPAPAAEPGGTGVGESGG